MAGICAAWHDGPVTSVNLIVAADEPAIFFASVEDAERSMEPVDAEDGVYTAAFGRNGEPHTISTDGRSVVIRRTDEAAQPDVLKALLFRYFAAMGETTSDDVSLTSLLDRCVPSYG